MVSKSIAFCTGTRAEYGLLRPLMQRVLDDNKNTDFFLFVTGMHLSPEFGKTICFIEDDKIPISERIEILLSADTPSAITKSMGLAMISFADVFTRYRPSMLILLGDRFETFCVAAAATVACIPIAHIHGGELTEGAIDDAFRHSISKMSYLHFTSTEEYRNRVIQLGEDPSRVFNVGAIGIETIKKASLLTRSSLESDLGIKFGKRIALVTFHPATLQPDASVVQMESLLESLKNHPSLFTVFTKANADTNGRIINEMIDEYVASHSRHALAFSSLGQLRYLSMMSISAVVIGNSSSGIIEAPSFGIPTVNIGDRQKGRVRAKSVIDCLPTTADITSALELALSYDFSSSCKEVMNPYEGMDVSRHIYEQISLAISQGITMKSFYGGASL